MKKLMLIRGLPGTGKSTRAKLLISIGEFHAHFEADMFFERDGKYAFNASRLPAAHQWCQKSAMDALLAGKNVVVSNTFTTAEEMFPYFAIAEEVGAKVEIVTLLKEFGSIHAVPESTMERMRRRFQSSETLEAMCRRGLYCNPDLVQKFIVCEDF